MSAKASLVWWLKPALHCKQHRADGLDVVHLFSGRVLCQLKLMQVNPAIQTNRFTSQMRHINFVQGLHADINRDGSVDHLYSMAGHSLASRSAHDKLAAAFADSDAPNAAPQPGCLIMATSGVPARDHLFNASVCHHQKDRLKGVQKDWARAPGALDSAEPVVVPSISVPGKLDTVFLLSNGRITSISPTGTVNWQTQTSATWRKEHIVIATGSDHAAALRTDSVVVASLAYFNLHADPDSVPHPDDLLLVACGEASMVLVSADEGRIRYVLLPLSTCSWRVKHDPSNYWMVQVYYLSAKTPGKCSCRW